MAIEERGNQNADYSLHDIAAQKMCAVRSISVRFI